MSEQQLLSADPNAGLLSTDPNAAAAPPPPSGYWEDRGIGGKVWHPANGASDRTRVDNSVLGMPPELAAVGALGVARAVGGAGLSAAQRAIAGAKAVAAQAAPTVKYELVRRSLEMGGIPSPIAIPLAMAISGYKKGAGAAEAEAEAVPDMGRIATKADRPNGAISPTPLRERFPNGLPREDPAFAAPATPVEPPAAPPESAVGGTPPPAGPPPAPTLGGSPAPPATPANYPQKFLNEVALQARRQGVTLTDADYAAARALTQQGKTAAEAVAQIAPPVPPPAVPKPRLTAEQAAAYMKLRATGKTDAEAKAALEAGLAFQDQYGLPTPTVAETKFPKGMRGKANPPAVPPR